MIASNRFKKDTIAFIESNTTGTGHLFIKEAKRQGLHPIFITKTPEKYAFLKEELLHPVILDTQHFTEMHCYLNTLSNLKGIFSSSDYFVEIACQLANALDLPSNDLDAVKLCRNKDLLARVFSEKGIPAPKTLIVHPSENWGLENLEATLNRSSLQFPIIIKPSRGTGSMGVRLCLTPQEALHQMTSQYLESTTTLLLQEYIQGDEYSVETFADNQTISVIGITKKYLSNPPFFVETGHDFPATLPTSQVNRIYELVIDTLKEIGLLFGPAHTEIRIKNEVPYIIEINPRLAGGMIPQIIQQAINVDLIAMTLSLIAGKSIFYNLPTKKYASIRFIMAPTSGVINTIKFNQSQKSSISDYQLYKGKYESINLQGDYRDRIGHVITTGTTLYACQQLANVALKSISIDMISYPDDSALSQEHLGRLTATLLPAAQQLIDNEQRTDQRLDELRRLCTIDEAHVIMLFVNKIISKEQTKSLLKQIAILQEDNFKAIINQPAPRGLYLLYENYLIASLGISIAGVTHTARSRNDINATLFKLKLRENFFQLYKNLWHLRSILLNQAKQHVNTPLPIYSQYQTALPTTLSHYLLAIVNACRRDQQALQSIYSDINTCPLGAAAGGGTTININQTLTAQLLGFTHHSSNSLDAVASRDLAARMHAMLCVAAMNLSRLSVDLQLWSTNEFGLIEFPDCLCGGSSMMPQKKNPYLLEKIQGLLSSLLGYFTTSINTMYKVPFGNSVEIGTESLRFLDSAFDDFNRAIALLILHLNNIIIHKNRIKASLLNNLTFSTYITEMLVKNGDYNFREAHQLVGKQINYAIRTHKDPVNALLNITPLICSMDLDPLKIAQAMDFGGGPGLNAMREQYQQALQILHKDAEWFHDKMNSVLRGQAMRKEYTL